MELKKLIEYCLSKKGGYMYFPFGKFPICFKIEKKVYAEIYPKEENYKITLKCEQS